MTDSKSETQVSAQLITQELQLELDKALKNLETYAESRDKRDYLSATRQLLSEVRGVLDLTGQTLLAALAQDMEGLLQRHLNQPDEDADAMLNQMAEGLLALHAAVSTGRVKRAAMITRLNGIRVITQSELASETDLFEVDLEKGLKLFSRPVEKPLDAAALQKIRALYRRVNKSLLAGHVEQETWSRAQQIFRALHQLSGRSLPSAIGYVGLALIRHYQAGTYSLEPVFEAQLNRLDQYLGALIEDREAEDVGLLKNLLFCLTQVQAHSEADLKVLRVFGVETFAAESGDADLSYDAELVKRVANELQNELNQTKLWLDDAINSVGDFPQTVRQLNTVFKRVVDTLSMVGVTATSEAVQELHERLQAWQEHDSISQVSAEDLQWFADHLVDLEEEVGHLARTGSTSPDAKRPKDLNAALDMVTTEGRKALESVKQAVNEFLESKDPGELADAPPQLQRLEGALRFYPLPRLADLTRSARRFIKEQLMLKGVQPDEDQAAQLADILVAVDYYLECLQQGTAASLDFLVERATEDCAALGYPAGEEEPEEPAEPQAEPPTESTEAALVDAGESAEADIAEPSPEQSAEAPATTETDEEEDEILAVFAEEAEELLPAAREHYAAWCGGSDEDLTDLRRAFHTLKGGGRMVGASVVGELSWAMENLLNKVLDGSVNAGQAVMQVVGDALERLPDLLSAMKAGAAQDEPPEVANLRETADLLANPAAVRNELAASENAAREEAAESDTASDTSELATETEAGSVDSLEFESEPEPETEPETEAEPETVEHLESEPEPELEPEPEQAETAGLLAQVSTIAEQARSSEDAELTRAARELKHLLQHHEFVGGAVPDTTASLVQRLQQAAEQGASREELGALSEQTYTQLADLETELVASSEEDRERRYRPVHRMLAEDLESLLTLGNQISLWQQGAPDTAEFDRVTTDLQSLESAARRARVDAIAALAASLREALQNQDRQSPLPESRAAVLLQAQEELVSMLDCVASLENVPGPGEELQRGLENIARPQAEPQAEPEVPAADSPEPGSSIPPQEQTPAPAVEEPATGADEDFDRELLETFLEEAEDLQTEVGEGLEAWQKAQDEFEHADAIHRSLHTLKGGARLAGLEQLGTLSHEFESLIIDRQVMRSVDAAFFEESFRHYDAIVGEIERVKEALSSGANMAILKSAGSAPAPEPAMQVTPLQDASAEHPQPVQDEEPEEEKAEVPAKERREQFRVEAELLDKMVNLAGEAIVFRGRVEAQVNGFDTILDELESTTDRIQSLSRRLDGETQAQIVFRREQIAEAGEEEDFDPLEMDRYSMLQQLSRQLIEAASDLQDLRASLSESTREAKGLLLQNSRIQTELNDRLMDTRMVPFSRIVPRLQRMTRQIASELNKKVSLDVGVVEGEMDRQVLDQILSPLEHILRNAIDHGIESEAERQAAGKDSAGRIGLDVKRDGAHMVLRISDDGKGVDVERIRQKAIENGLVSDERAASMDEKALLDIIFAPGFSTARELTQISGRGVGMDVVRSKVRQLGGSVEIESEPGKGTTFKLYLPFTLSVNRALMVRIADDTYALPLASLEALVRISKEELAKYYEDPERRLIYGSNRYRYGYLGEFLYTLAKPELVSIDENSIPLVLFRSGEHALAIQVDEILGSQEVVVKSLGRPLHDVPGLAGAAIMGDGSVVVTLDMFTLLQAYDRRHAEEEEVELEAESLEPKDDARTPRIMVVDDSVTVRKVTGRFLAREGFLVETARDGVEALRQVHEQKPDLMLVDLEMPRMDGFELLSILRSNERFADLPVFIITSRTGEKHRERGLELGAQRYFGKPYREDELVQAISEQLNLDARRKFK